MSRSDTERIDTGSQFGMFKVSVLSVMVGVLSGIAAEVLHRLIGLVTNLAFYQRLEWEIISPLGTPHPWLLIVMPALGGLIVGMMARFGTTLVRGHGIPEAMEAVLLKRSRISPKVAILKPISAAVSIGSGQPFGAEGPIIQTGAALGSLLGQAFRMTPAERKVLLACGAAGGIAATFGTPVAAVILSIELLLFEFRTRSFIPLVIASTLATVVHIGLAGPGPVFHVPGPGFGGPINLIFFVGLGVLAGFLGAGFTRFLYLIEDAYERLPVTTYLWPALGGLFVGVVGWALPRIGFPGADVFGPGYDVIQNILDGKYALVIVIVILLGKMIVWLVSLGSGTSGGILAPQFLIGAALGSAYGVGIARLFPGMDALPVAFAMAGMAAVFGSSTRATFAAIIFAFEITQDYHAILPIMLASVVADLIAHRLMPTNLLTEQLRRSGVLVNQEYEADPLQMIAVSNVMVKEPVVIPTTMKIGELMDRINRHEELYSRHQALLIADESGRLQGIITRGDLLRSMGDGANSGTPVIDVAARDLLTTYPDEPVRTALERMLRADVGRLPVVSRDDPSRIVGYLARGSIIEAYRKRLDEEAEVEAGWLKRVQP